MNAPRWTIATIVVSHFVAAFAALGMPPFFPLILRQSLHSESSFLAGWFYVLPTLFMALSSPWWGALADHFGKKALLLRAQLGLAGSFLLAGFANSVPMFLLALVLQGVLGGTFSASNAYLATVVRGASLTRILTLMQGSARAALVVAPAVLGALMTVESPIELYRYLALLPLGSALLIWWLPSPAVAEAEDKHAEPMRPGNPIYRLIGLQSAFVFATVVTFPYFVTFAQQRLPGLSTGAAGLLFGLPHLIYLLSAAPLSLWLGQRRLTGTLSIAFLLLAASLVGQALAHSAAALIAWRVVMGLAMTAGFIALHGVTAQVTDEKSAGRTFGRLESGSKWGAVAAGTVAGVAVERLGAGVPFLLGALILGSIAFYLLGASGLRSHRQV